MALRAHRGFRPGMPHRCPSDFYRSSAGFLCGTPEASGVDTRPEDLKRDDRLLSSHRSRFHYLSTFLTNARTHLSFRRASVVFHSGCGTGERGGEAERGSQSMKVKLTEAGKRALAFAAIGFVLAAQYGWAQNLGSQPQFNVAVQGQTGAQPEGAFLNFINWIGNVIAPVGAGGAVLAALVSWMHGRGAGRWLVAAAGLLAVSGLTRLIEFWITSGTGGVT